MQNLAAHLRQRPGRRRNSRRPGAVENPRLGGDQPRPTDGAQRHRIRPVHWRDAGEPHRQGATRQDHQRHPARPAAALARGRHRHPARAQSPEGRHLHSLARHHPAGQHGRRAGPELPGHRAGRHVRVPLPGEAARHLLVPQPFRLPGAVGRLRPHRDRTEGAGALPVRPRLRGDAERLDRRRPGPRHGQAEEAVGLLQPAQAHRGRLHR
ncbi:hypothetical protein D3C81_1492000 [compost metagenome]